MCERLCCLCMCVGMILHLKGVRTMACVYVCVCVCMYMCVCNGYLFQMQCCEKKVRTCASV